MNGSPQELLPGDPVCAPVRTVLAETSVSLVRSLSFHSMWKVHVVSAMLKGLQEVRSALLLTSDKEDVDKDSFNVNTSCFQPNQATFTDDNKDKAQVCYEQSGTKYN